MATERRDTPRIPYALDAVMVGSGGRDPLPCRTRDISLNGAFVQLRGARSHPVGTVELMVNMPLSADRKPRRFHAQIVHVSANGVGLFFDRTNSEGYVPLIKLVFAKRKLPELL